MTYTLKTIKCFSKRLKKSNINGKIFHVHGSGDLLLLEEKYFPKWVRLTQPLFESQWNFFAEIDRIILKFKWKCQLFIMAKNLEKGEWSWRAHISDFKTYYRATVVMMMYYWCRDRHTDW